MSRIRGELLLFVLVSLPVLSRVDSESWGNNTGLTGLFSWNVLTISFPWVSVETPELAAVLYSVSWSSCFVSRCS